MKARQIRKSPSQRLSQIIHRGLGVVLLVFVFLSALLFAAQKQDNPPHQQDTSSASQAGSQDKPQPSPAEKDRSRRREAYTLYPKAFDAAERGNVYQAMEIVRQVIKLNPSSPEPHVTLGEFQYSVRNTNEARNEALAALKLDPKHAGAHKLLGRIYRDEALPSGDRDKAKQAIEEFRKVVEVDDSDVEAWQSLAQVYEMTGQQEELIKALTRWTSNDPTAEQAFAALASFYFSQRKYREAAENASRALTLQPTPENAILLARSLLAQGQTADALRIYREARERNPGETELEVSYAEALVYAGQYQEAITALKEQLKLHPRTMEALRLLAQAYRRSGRRQEAIQTLKDALHGIDVSDSLDLQLLLAQIYEEVRQIDDAVATYQSILDVILNPDGTVSKKYDQAAEEIVARIGLTYRRAGRRQEAIRAFERMRTVLGSDNPHPDLLIIDTLMEERNYDEAIKQAREAATRYPEKREFRLAEAQALGYLGRVEEAMKLLDSLLINSIEDIGVLSMKAAVLSDAERYKEAKAALEEGLRRDPRNTSLLIQLSIVQEKLKQPAEAEATLRAILERDPDNEVVLNNLGYYLAERGERLDEALALIQRAVNIAPTTGSFLDSLGWVYFQMGRLTEALNYLEQALEYEPRDATIHDHLGDVFRRQGRLDQARRSYERALELARSKEDRERIEKKLQQLSAQMK
ncbi:MAG: tetratricopeptide repeat protein [Acidobacteria bacterium]|nr:tetratricopeptide repeat protein [Acidobacteriota bacterium]